MFAVLILYDIIREANVKIDADMWARNTHGAKKEKRRVYGYFICASTLYSGNMNLLVNTIQASLKQIFFFSIYDYFKYRKEKYICTNAYVYVHE